MPTLPLEVIVIRVPVAVVPFVVVLKASEVPWAVSVQFSAARTNMPPRVRLNAVAP